MGADLLHHAHLVGDDHHGDTQLFVDIPDQLQNLPGGVGVQRTGGLVAQQYLGVGGQCAGDGDALLLAAGQLGRVGTRLVGQTYQLQQLTGALLRLGLLHARQLHGKADIPQAAALHQQIEPLEDHGDLPPRRPQLGGGHGVQPLAVDDDLAAGRLLQQVDAPHQRALTGAGHTDDAVNVAVFDGEGDVLESVYPAGCAGIKCFADVLQFDHGRPPPFSLTWWSAHPAWSACRRTGPWAPRG